MRAAIFAFAALAATLPALAQAPMAKPGAPDPARVTGGTYAVDSSHTQVMFKVDHLGFNSYFGIFGGATGSLTLDRARPGAASVSIVVPIEMVVTTSGGLNTHLKGPDFFDVAKFPTATFKSTSVAVSGTTARIAGTLTLKGVTRPIVLDAKFTGAGGNPMSKSETIGFEATTTVKRSDFGISYGVPMVSDVVPLTITAAFEKK